ncbi:MAG: transketolase [Candidatus Harrisonbacteria bacterium CG10_big_fil_rev_8_21_14_0_10_44_23]|uniref:Transketolase n=1 Tax=Candidatus Harrisonbacteria bacterium CG10_big_fil_rev_8_21_14_0_10_44_23 TaxID=1974585 RepID=A0A2H0UQ45_9BACT|nr:MAG: transketolase [Candidatus Harrisonbacteria bacterium CG10_big_fil_rev_8_21_14_0_10_44_23]
MLNKKVYLDNNLFSDKAKQAALRDGYGEGLFEAGKKDPNVVALCADLKDSTRSNFFAKAFPNRFFEIGIAEQNMVAVAAGLAVSGKIPFVASYATFSPGRAWEQIRTTVAYNDANVKIAGHHAGISVGPDGATHQAIEDIATMRAIPNMTVIAPCDANEAKKATLAAAKFVGPMYLRFARENTPIMTTARTPFKPGKAEIFYSSSRPQVAIIACGPLVHKALVAAKELEKEKIKTIVVNSHTIKPLDSKTILEVVEKTGAVVSVEEHQVIGGLGSAVAELLAKEKPTPMEFVGMQDVFGESGEPEELLDKYKMSVEDIKEAVRKVKKRK